jgi:tetratricopeptide (TPR) repeat protein
MNTAAASSRTNDAPAADGGRLAGLSAQAAGLMRQAGECLERGDFARAASLVAGAAAFEPAHPEVLRLQGLLLGFAARYDEALPLLRRAAELRPDDAPTLSDLAGVQHGLGDFEAAFASWRRACAAQPDYLAAWFNLGRNLKAYGRTEEAAQALERAVALAPDHAQVCELYADVLIDRGRFDEAVAVFKRMIAQRATTGNAWWGLAKIATRRLDDAELAQLEKVLRHPDLSEQDRMLAGFALGKAREDRGRFADAFAAYRSANLIARNRRPWNAPAFSASIDGTLAAFADANERAAPADLGSEIIFLVSLPRAGSTLAEQILASHHDVEGAGELTDVVDILKDESRVRGRDFPHWVPEASAADWERLGRRYLERTAHWRARRPRSTDKMPNNWLVLGAIQAMLPGARIVDCRRDPLETCWSCYKQFFGRGVEFSYDLDDLGAFWRDYDRAMRFWSARRPEQVRTQQYESLLADPEAEIRALLDFCGLDFDSACLNFHEAGRDVRTASASQVRQPLKRDTARAASYGELLAPLRAALVRAPDA